MSGRTPRAAQPASDAPPPATGELVREPPPWHRPGSAEARWPTLLAVVVAAVLQLALPDRLALRPHWLLPVLELVLLGALTAGNPVRLTREHVGLRAGSTGLIALITLANAVSAVLLIRELVSGRAGDRAGPLLASGAAVYLTNIIAFALWYWEYDRGGPFDRAAGRRTQVDFAFPQMTSPDLAPGWRPQFADYLYLSFTNATAFSPTDTMPFTRWAKMLMLVQSAVALATIALVVARAVNIFK